MSSLTILSLHGNSLNGGIPDNVCQYLPNIQVQNLGNNQFGGPLPSKLWPCKELLELVLENNNFSGSIPKNMGNLAQLMEIYIACNNLTDLRCQLPDEGFQNANAGGDCEKNEDEDDFSFTCTNPDGSPISTDDIFQNAVYLLCLIGSDVLLWF